MIDLGVLILAGGEATRLPGKLTLDAGHVPMIARVYRNVSPGRMTYVSCKETFPSDIDDLLPCTMVVDKWAQRGPLSGLISTMGEMNERYVFAVAGDSPFIDRDFIDRLAMMVRDGDEAVVPKHPGGIEPLAAIYERDAFLREGYPILKSGKGALRMVIEKLRTRYVPIDEAHIFTNVNTREDYESARGAFA
jgi:molybdopterin-guanine dinucleotide biosynthesis protein A